jgi:hypothetical protein
LKLFVLNEESIIMERGMHKIIFFILSISFFFKPLQAKLWTAENEWDLEWESRFAQWMQSPQVHNKLFTSKNSPYYGIKADCADASYALRAIFSMENSLPFRVINPSGGRNAFNYLSNELTKFDRYTNPAKRLVAFINYLGSQVGTEHLSYHDTTPVKLSEIKPGMLFTYKILRSTGKTIRHSYNIKDVTQTGNFDVIYATQAIAKSGADMMYRKEYMFSNPPHSVWGFKRFKWPHLHGIEMNRYPEEFGYSHEQFGLVSEMGDRPFFRLVKRTLQEVEETPQDLLARSLNLVCTQAQDRVMYVNQALEFMERNGRRCMNYSDYDAYSTPARDKALSEAFYNLFANRNDVEKMGKAGEVDSELWELINDIEDGSRFNFNSSSLLKSCAVTYRPGKTIHLAELYRRMQKGLLSSHPNDRVENRWGETSRNGTRCRVWY